MLRIAALAILLVAAEVKAVPCDAKVTRNQAIVIAKKAVVRTWGKFAGAFRYTAELRGCIWEVVAHTPPDDVSGDLGALVDAQSGKVSVNLTRLRTDPRKFRKMKIIRVDGSTR